MATKITTGCLYGGAKSTDRIRAYWTSCGKTEQCNLYREGKCACFRFLLGPNIVCPNAETHYEIGPTKRAKSYDDFKRKFHDRFSGNVKEFKDKLTIVPGYVFLPMAYLSGTENPLEKVEGSHFVPTDDFDEDFIEKLVKHKPRPWFGVGYIEEYSSVEIPKFIQQLREELPEMYKAWADKYPNTAEKFSDVTPVGRRAYVKTLCDNSIIKTQKGVFIKEGGFLKCDNVGDIWLLGNIKTTGSSMMISINDEMIVTVDRYMITDSNTKYID